jgi:hypothetical protein
MKIYIYLDYSNDKYKTIQSRCLAKGHEVELVTSITHLNPTCCIIGTNVEFQYHIFKHIQNINYYQIFDDKCGFYKFLNENKELWNGLYLIPSYDKSYNGENINKSFMVKKNNGYSALFNEIIKGNIKDIIAKYGSTHQIQELLNVKHILGISLCCKLGKIISVYSYNSNESITATNLVSGFCANRYNYILYPEVRNFLKKLIARVSYNGFIEIEFLIDNNNKIHIMECNPRLTGSIRVPVYFDLIVNEYINNYFKTFNQITEIDLEDTRLWKQI